MHYKDQLNLELKMEILMIDDKGNKKMENNKIFSLLGFL